MVNPIQTTSIQNPLVRIVGVDSNKVGAPAFQYPQLVGVPNTADASAKQAQQNVTQGYEIAANTYGRLAQQKGVEAQAYSQRGNAFSGFDKVAQTLNDMTIIEQKRKQAELQAQQDKNFTTLQLDVDTIVSEAVQEARTVNPIQARQDGVRRILESNTDESNKRVALNKLFTGLDGVYKDWDSNMFKAAEKAKSAYESDLEMSLRKRTYALQADLTRGDVGVDRANQILDQADQAFDEAIGNSNLDPVRAMELRGKFLGGVLDNAFIGAKARASIQERASEYTKASNEVITLLNDKYGGDQSSSDFKNEVAIIAAQHGLPSSFKVYGKEDQFKEKLDFEKTREALVDLEQKRLIDKRAAQTYPLFSIGTMVFKALKSPEYLAGLDPRGDKVIIQVHDQWKKDQTKYKTLRNQMWDLRTQLSAALNPKDNVTESVTTSNDPILGAAQGNTSITKSVSKGIVDQAKVDALRSEFQSKQYEQQQLADTWKPYGLDNFDSPDVSFKEAQQRNAGVSSQVQEYKNLNPNRVAGQGGDSATYPNFKRVPKLASYQGMITPFAQGTAFEIGRSFIADPHGDGTGHSYPARDFAVASDTKLHAVAPGTVVHAGMKGAYGLSVVVKMPDGGSYIYGHLNSLSVKRGDTVQPGQLVALSGGAAGDPRAGRSTGPHLHFDVTDANGHNIDPNQFLKSIPQQLQRPSLSYGLPPNQSMGNAYGLSVIRLANKGYIKDNIYYEPGGGVNNLATGSSTRIVSASNQKLYDRLNESVGITAQKATEYGYRPQAEVLPKELRGIPGTNQKLAAPAATAYQRMVQAAKAEGINLYPISAHRSVKDQHAILKEKVRRGMSPDEILKYSAPAGYSEHHTGTALDIGTSPGTDLNEAFENTTAFQWLKSNGPRFGFKLSYDKNTSGKGTSYEPWHWRYEGGDPAAGKVSTAKPLRMGRAPITKNFYPKKSDLDDNYGYGALAEDKPYARKLNQVANNLGIPGQWLADVIDYENDTHNPSRRGGSGNAYVGLIQFGAAAASDMGTTQEALAGMSRVQQLDYVQKYLSRWPGKLNTIEDVYAAINIGNPLDTPLQRSAKADGNNAFSYHAKRLGMRAGRRYQTSYDAASAIHTTYHANCSFCNSLPNKGNNVPAHYAA
jgi:zinc D-Ala-D-Ala carboxypeptidase